MNISPLSNIVSLQIPSITIIEANSQLIEEVIAIPLSDKISAQ